MAHRYRYRDRGGTRASALALGIDEHCIIKTLVFQTHDGAPLVVLMHGDRSVSSKQLARHIQSKSVAPCAPLVAERHTGYRVGGTSPFGLRKPLPIYVEYTIFECPRVYINGGQRGLLVSLEPTAIEQLLQPNWVEVAI